LGAAIRQMPCRADASPTIAAVSCQYDNIGPAPSVAQTGDSLLREIPPSILHHLEEIRPGVLDSHPIHLSHLFSRHGRYFDAGIREVT
jgi:hypothetical protein